MSQRNVQGLESLALWLIGHAAHQAPGSLSERLEEEWRADLAARTSGISRLRFALGCCWATQVIAHEHQPSRVAVGSAAIGPKAMAAFADQNFSFISLRSSTFFLVASLHAVLLYGFMTALSHTHRSALADPLQNQVLKNPPRQAVPVALPDPQLKRLPDEFYPEAARRLREQGIATVQVCVDAAGRLTSDPTTLQGAGSPRLDEGALKLARAGSGHYRAATEDGQPVNSCYPLRIRFQLKN